MQIIFQKLIIRWQPYPSWKQRTWSSHWCSALRALLFGLILAEMDALSALAGRDFRSSCTITEAICQQSPNWGWQLCVPERVTLQKQGCCCFPWSWERCHRPQPTLPCPAPLQHGTEPCWEHLCWAHTDTEQLQGVHEADSSLALGISQAQLQLSVRLYRCKPSPDVV